MLVRQLPPHSRTITAQIDATRDDPPPKDDGPMPTPRWGSTEFMLADVYDMLQALQSTIISAAYAEAGSKKRPPKVKPYPRPTDRRPLSRRQKREQFEALVAQARFEDPQDPSSN